MGEEAVIWNGMKLRLEARGLKKSYNVEHEIIFMVIVFLTSQKSFGKFHVIFFFRIYFI